MPSGKTHDRITLWGLPLVLTAAFYLTLDITLTVIVCISFLVGGFMMGPDLDIHSVQYRRWGPLRWIWLPYQKTIKHRSQLSHGPVIGTVLRVLYLGLWIALFGLVAIELLTLLGAVQLTWADLRSTVQVSAMTYFSEWMAPIVGLELGALSHYVSDHIGSQLKKQRRKRQRRRK
ncbi:MAG: metal-binding protein [Leptolyngbya sp. SIO4C1]|nr:metal-binding protein [Leptolyngbya sp. SIO4C1]